MKIFISNILPPSLCIQQHEQIKENLKLIRPMSDFEKKSTFKNESFYCPWLYFISQILNDEVYPLCRNITFVLTCAIYLR